MPTSPFRSRQFMTPFSISWFVCICIHLLALYSLGIDWPVALTDSVVSNVLLIFVSMLIFTMLRFYLPRTQGFLNLFIWVALLTAGWFFFSNWLLGFIFQEDKLYRDFLLNGWPVRVAIGFLITGCSALIGYAYYNWQEKKELDQQKADAERSSKEAELYKLRQQLQPHFLFNALNSINALIGAQPAQARTMVQQLSEFLRTTLKKEEKQWVKLEEEMKSLQLYLEIEKVRFGNRLLTEIETDADALQASLPALLLQPLVENAIKFGLYDTTDAATIRLKAFVENNRLMIIIQNPFDPETAVPGKGTGFGLSSAGRRLFLLFGRNDLLHTEAKENTFIIKVQVPQFVQV